MIELHPAFVWDCEQCGKENIHRAISGSISDLDPEVGYSELSYEAPEDEFHDVSDEEFDVSSVTTRVTIVPTRVHCKFCHAMFQCCSDALEE